MREERKDLFMQDGLASHFVCMRQSQTKSEVEPT